MSYIGNSLPANFQSLPAVQRFNGNASATAFTLASAVANDQSILVSVDGVTQDSNAYSVSGTTLTFTAAPSAGTGNIFVNTISPVGSTVVPPDGLAITATTGTFSGDVVVGAAGGSWNGAANGRDVTVHGASATTTGVGQISVQATDAFGADLGGGISFGGEYVAGSNVDFSTISGRKENATSNNSAGYMQLNTRANGGNMTERMRINSSGNVGIGTSAPTVPLHVATTTNTAAIFTTNVGSQNADIVEVSATGSATSANIKMKVTASSAQAQIRLGGDNALIFSNTTSDTERMRIASGGTLEFNSQGASQITLRSTASGSHIYTAFSFRNSSSSDVGNIAVGTSSTAYNTSSDYRLKENVDYTWDATTRLKQLKPARFNFIIDETNTLVDGFLAHEVSSIVPEAISGTKDAMTTEVLYVEDDVLPEGKSIGDVKEASVPDYQGIDQSKLVPLLVKTIQELEARLTAGGL